MTKEGSALVCVQQAKPVVKIFRESMDRRGDAMQNRRDLLVKLLAISGLAATESVVNLASASASSIELNSDFDHALSDVTRKVYQIGRDHMVPGADAEAIRADAVAAWRDAFAIRAQTRRLTRQGMIDRAQTAEALAAGLVAQFWGDIGKTDDAVCWYNRAMQVAPDKDTRAWLLGCSAWLGLYGGETWYASRQAYKAVLLTGFENYERGMFAFGQLARSFAQEGNVPKAREALSEARNRFIMGAAEDAVREPANLLKFKPVQHAQYMTDTLATLSFIEGNERDIRQGENYLDMAVDLDDSNGMNKALLEFSRAKMLASGSNADPEAAVEVAMNVIVEVSESDRASAVVQARAKSLAVELDNKFDEVACIKAFSGYVDEMIKAA